MAINFYKNHDQIVSAYKEVLDPKCNTNWVVYGYEKQTNNLAVIGKGNGGLAELQNEFSQSKILYAFCEVKDDSNNLRRFILINWQGECAPLQRKGICMNHFSDIRSFFKDANIVLNARHEDDVEPEALKQHFEKLVSRIIIAKPTNGFANHDTTTKPIGTNYQKTVAQAEISKKERELFWQKQKQEEEKRLEEEKIKTNNRNNEMKRLENVNTANNNHHESADESSNNNVNQVNLLRKERMDEAKSLISKNSISNARAFFEQNSSSTPNIVKTNVNNKIIDNKSTYNHVNSIKNKLIENSNDDKTTKNSVQELPKISSQVNDNEEIDDMVERMVEYDGVEDKSSSEESIPNQIHTTEYQSYQTYFPEPRLLENIEEEQIAEEDEECQKNGVETNDGGEQQMIMSNGLQARALYDYQAADDTEISFDPDDIITHVEQIDSGWWQGLAPNGDYGLFPANYVELIE